ncbi:MAG: hypothetical protein ACI8XO_004935 [Verrucomicrobiales bacterium]|jgi:hypothetical protein
MKNNDDTNFKSRIIDHCSRLYAGLALLVVILMLLIPRAEAVLVDVELSLVIDVSNSVDVSEYNLQMDGYANAFRDPAVQANILGGTEGAIAVNAVFFASDYFTTTLDSWRILDSAVAIEDFADELDVFPRPGGGGTDIASGMDRSRLLFDANGFESSNQVMDVSGDGTSNVIETSSARDAAETADIKVNGLPIDNGVTTTISDYYAANVVTPGGFVEIASTFADFEAAVKRKILMETGGDGGDCQVEVVSIDCPDEVDGAYTVNFNLTNGAPNTAFYAWLTPCLDGDLPPGAITLQPEPVGVFPLDPPIPSGDSGSLTIQLPGGASISGETVCFRITLLDRSGGQCCTTKLCVELPPCDCAELMSSQIDCQALSDGTIKYTLTLTVRNRTDFSDTPFTFWHANFLPPDGFDSASVTLSPEIAPGDTGTITTCYYGAPGELCFSLALHDDTLENCCSLEDICLTLPPCGAPCQPDTCQLTRRVPCCPSTGMATIVYTICNNCDVPRTYTWTADGFATPGCDDVLTAAMFTPSSGTIGPVLPGECASVTIMVRCDALAPAGQGCAGFQICAESSPLAPKVCCDGVVYVPQPGEIVIKQANPGLVLIDQDPTQVSFTLENPSDNAVQGTLGFADQRSALAFAVAGAGSGMTEFFTSVSLQPKEKKVLVLDVFQMENETATPDFTEVFITPSLGAPFLQLPMQLALPDPPLGQRARRGIRAISLSPEPTPQVVVRFATEVGKRYQIQESGDLLGWADMSCTVVDVEVDAGGRFIGTGSEVVCVVPCGEPSPAAFYRVVEVAE